MASDPLRNLIQSLKHREVADSSGVSDADLLRRFALGQDEAAFELLVWRHGSMVLNTCRRILGDHPEVEDAFQATFLVLAGKASVIREAEALGGWLHQVAHRIALRARKAIQARRSRELSSEVLEARTPSRTVDERGLILEEEIARLPEKLRVVVVLCYLQGETNEQAARHLGCPTGTVQSRLSRARDRLRCRLERRGLESCPLILDWIPTSVPLAAASVESVTRLATGSADDPLSHSVSTLVLGVSRAMSIAKFKAPLVLILGLVGLGGFLLVSSQGADPIAPRSTVVHPRIPRRALDVEKPVPPMKLPLEGPNLTRVDEVHFSPRGPWLVLSGSRPGEDGLDPLLLLWHRTQSRFLRQLQEAEGAGGGLEFSPDGKTLALASLNQDEIVLRDVDTWKPRARLRGQSLVSEILFGPDGRTLASRSYLLAGMNVASDLRVWETRTGKQLHRLLAGVGEGFTSMAFSADGTHLAVGTNQGRVRSIDLTTGKPLRPLTVLTQGAVLLAFAPNGKTLATWSAAGTGTKEARLVRTWEVATGKAGPTFESKDGDVRIATYSPDGKTLACAGSTGKVIFWDVATRKEKGTSILSRAARVEIRSLTFAPNGQYLAVSGWELEKDLGTGRLLSKLVSSVDGRERITWPDGKAVSFAPDGRTLVLVTGETGAGVNRKPDEVKLLDLGTLLREATRADREKEEN